MITLQKKVKGFTLLEIMLVLAIASSLFVLLMNYSTQKAAELRRDKTVLQVQQILNAGMSFYLNKGYWPLVGATISSTGCGAATWTDTSVLRPNYIPTNLINNSYAKQYYVTCSTAANGGNFYVAFQVDTAANASIIAGKLPLAYTSSVSLPGAGAPPVAAASGTTVIASVNIPGQNLNNARSINFAGVYYSGSCVPAPNCPPNMKPSILVMPVAVAGVYKPNGPVSCSGTPLVCTGPTSPVSSFTAYAKGGNAAGDPVGASYASNGGPLECTTNNLRYCQTVQGLMMGPDGNKYWRVCLKVTTESGDVSLSASTISDGKMQGSVVAMTRCVPNNGNESPSGSVDVFQAP